MENPIILLLEDCPVTGLLIEHALLKGLPSCRLVWARGIEEARQRIVGLHVELFIVDIGLPDGSGLDFLWAMAADHPSARAIVMTASALPEYRANSAALGALHFLEKPLNIEALCEHVRKALDTEQSSSASSEFRASLKNVTPVDVVQLKCLANSTTMLEFKSREGVGCIHIRGGEMIHAEAGVLRGDEAVYELVSWKHGQLSERPASSGCERTIHSSWQAVLMNAAQRIDERQLARC